MDNIFFLKRLDKLIDHAIRITELDLSGLTVLTEAASGNFIATSLIAAKANAKKVIAVCKDSNYGKAQEVLSYSKESARFLDVTNQIEFTEKPAIEMASRADVVTNLGFVRPIDCSFISKLPGHAVIALMWEPWEVRNSDVDVEASESFKIPIVGTRESDPRLLTYDYLGILAIKLLLEVNIEIFKSNIAVIGSSPFGTSIKRCLKDLGAKVSYFSNNPDQDLSKFYNELSIDIDALVVAEHKNPKEIIGLKGGIDPHELAFRGIQIIHICGNIDKVAVKKIDLSLWPKETKNFGYMSVTTDYVGPKPLVYLHTGGLRAAEVAVRVRKKGGSIEEALKASEETGLGLRLE